jgi:hypothetical protein
LLWYKRTRRELIRILIPLAFSRRHHQKKILSQWPWLHAPVQIFTAFRINDVHINGQRPLIYPWGRWWLQKLHVGTWTASFWVCPFIAIPFLISLIGDGA